MLVIKNAITQIQNMGNLTGQINPFLLPISVKGLKFKQPKAIVRPYLNSD